MVTFSMPAVLLSTVILPVKSNLAEVGVLVGGSGVFRRLACAPWAIPRKSDAITIAANTHALAREFIL
jgi:hypothetical protein